MCGEHDASGKVSSTRTGSSPHVRGAQRRDHGADRAGGIIPACAGSTNSIAQSQYPARDHPRMCGEHSPQAQNLIIAVGSSPHVRGARSVNFFYFRRVGIIPACAGSTSRASCSTPFARDHPRMCGEHSRYSLALVTAVGSSPHVRGAPAICCCPSVAVGIIPACAGSTPKPSQGRCVRRDHPRMCGEHALGNPNAKTFEGSSPHVRGARLLPRNLRSPPGIIPACAGSTDRGGESIL